MEHGLALSSVLHLAALVCLHAHEGGAHIHVRTLGPFRASGLFRSALRARPNRSLLETPPPFARPKLLPPRLASKTNPKKEER